MHNAKLWYFLRKSFEIVAFGDTFILHFAFYILH